MSHCYDVTGSVDRVYWIIGRPRVTFHQKPDYRCHARSGSSRDVPACHPGDAERCIPSTVWLEPVLAWRLSIDGFKAIRGARVGPGCSMLGWLLSQDKSIRKPFWTVFSVFVFRMPGPRCAYANTPRFVSVLSPLMVDGLLIWQLLFAQSHCERQSRVQVV